MSGAIKYLINERGSKTSVIVLIKTWEKMNESYEKLKNKLNLLVGLKSALLEVEQLKKSGKKLQTLKDFLNESNS